MKDVLPHFDFENQKLETKNEKKTVFLSFCKQTKYEKILSKTKL